MSTNESEVVRNVDDASETYEEKASNVLALPTTVSGLLDLRKTKNKQTLNDQIEVVHMDLWTKEEYRILLDAVYVEQAVEGSLIADDFLAATMIRKHAKETGNKYVAGQKLDTIRKCLGVVLRRFGISRKERRDT